MNKNAEGCFPGREFGKFWKFEEGHFKSEEILENLTESANPNLRSVERGHG